MRTAANHPGRSTGARLLILGTILLVGAGVAESVVYAAYEHDFGYHATTGTYSFTDRGGVQHNPTVSEVQRDLNGSLCSKCHVEELAEVKDSVHFRLQAPTQRIMFPGGGGHGMLDRACGLPGTTGLINYTSDVNLGECAKCHTGRYLPVMEGAFTSMFLQMGLPDPAGQAANLVNSGIDCLICHADVYTAVPEATQAAGYAEPLDDSPTPEGFARAARDNTDFDRDGSPDALIDTSGDGVADVPLMFDTDGDGVPDTPWQTVAQDRSPEAVVSTGATSEYSCLRCHEHARTGYKRATLFEAGYDVHATVVTGPFAGASNRCTVCHVVPDADGDGDPDHKFVRGHDVGGDLGAADFPPPPPGVPADPDDPTHLTCVQCHDDLTRGAGKRKGSVHSDRHLAVIACQTCHIPLSGGITYSMYGHGAHLSFGRNTKGEDGKLINADHMVAHDHDDIAADFAAYRMTPTLVWFNGGTSFLAQTLAVRGSPNAKIFPFKPMANGMVFDARFFEGHVAYNEAESPYNAHSMYRFFANVQEDCEPPAVCGNAEVFAALGMLDLTPAETRAITLMDFMSEDPNRQAMAMMQIFPNMINFDKQRYGYEHYLVASDSPWDVDGDGHIDARQDFLFDMLAASNTGLAKFQGFNAPMGLPADYEWYPPFEVPDQLVTMKLPDGSLMKMFLQMQAAQLPEEQREAFLAAVENYPAFSNGITLGGHGVRPKDEALGAGARGCQDCHGKNGILTAPIPVTRKVAVDMPGMGQVGLPLYQWRYYNTHALVNLGLRTTSEQIVDGKRDVDVGGNRKYVRTSQANLLLNWFMPDAPNGYRRADDAAVLNKTGLKARQLTWNGGRWMPVLEPVVDFVPNYAVLGYQREELIWPKGKRGGNRGSQPGVRGLQPHSLPAEESEAKAGSRVRGGPYGPPLP